MDMGLRSFDSLVNSAWGFMCFSWMRRQIQEHEHSAQDAIHLGRNARIAFSLAFLRAESTSIHK